MSNHYTLDYTGKEVNDLLTTVDNLPDYATKKYVDDAISNGPQVLYKRNTSINNSITVNVPFKVGDIYNLRYTVSGCYDSAITFNNRYSNLSPNSMVSFVNKNNEWEVESNSSQILTARFYSEPDYFCVNAEIFVLPNRHILIQSQGAASSSGMLCMSTGEFYYNALPTSITIHSDYLSGDSIYSVVLTKVN